MKPQKKQTFDLSSLHQGSFTTDKLKVILQQTGVSQIISPGDIRNFSIWLLQNRDRDDFFKPYHLNDSNLTAHIAKTLRKRCRLNTAQSIAVAQLLTSVVRGLAKEILTVLQACRTHECFKGIVKMESGKWDTNPSLNIYYR